MKFKIGDTVKISANSDSSHSMTGAIISIWNIQNEDQSKIFKYPIGAILYSINLTLGSDALVSEELIELYHGKIRKSKFDYGDEIIISCEAPLDFKPGEIGSICGISFKQITDSLDEDDLAIGTYEYTVEYIDGSSNEIPEEFLEIFNDN